MTDRPVNKAFGVFRDQALRIEVEVTCINEDSATYQFSVFDDATNKPVDLSATVNFNTGGVTTPYSLRLDDKLSGGTSRAPFSNALLLGSHANFMPGIFQPIVQAHEVRVRLTTASGQQPNVRFTQNDPVLRRVISHCSHVPAEFQRAAPAPTPTAPASLDQDAQVETYEHINDKCRGGSGDDPATQTVCERRDAAYKNLVAQGICYGHEDEITADYKWHTCDEKSLR